MGSTWGLQAFNIQSIPRIDNKHVDRLAAIGVHYDVPEHVEDKRHIRLVVRPVVPDNHTNWQVFDSDVQIVNFLQNEAEFSNRNQSKLQNQYGNQIMNLGSNKLPKGLITLESFSNPDDQPRSRGLNLATNKDDHIPIDIVDGKVLSLGNLCSKDEWENFVHLCPEFNDVFAWTYDD